jgi:hypothetical protein
MLDSRFSQTWLRRAFFLGCMQVYVTHVKYRSARKCRWKFWRKFHNKRVPSRQTIHHLVNKLRTIGLLIDKKEKLKYRVLTEGTLDDIGARLEHTPWKLLKHLAQETGVSKSCARTATKLLKSSHESWCLVCCKCKKDCEKYIRVERTAFSIPPVFCEL